MAVDNARSRIYVDHKVQGGVLVRLATLWLITTWIAIALVTALFTFGSVGAGDGQTAFRGWRLAGPMLMAALGTLPVICMYLVRFTHRFAGPILRLRRDMERLCKGDVKPLKFRKNDYWQDLAGDFNRVAEVLTDARERIAELEAELQSRKTEEILV